MSVFAVQQTEIDAVLAAQIPPHRSGHYPFDPVELRLAIANSFSMTLAEKLEAVAEFCWLHADQADEMMDTINREAAGFASINETARRRMTWLVDCSGQEPS